MFGIPVTRNATILLCCAAFLGATLAPGAAVRAASPDEQRGQIRRTAQDTLNQLYAAQPSARQAIEQAAGYAVFSEISTKILLAGGGGGKGVVVDRKNGQETFMLMATLQAGYGMGIEKIHLVWVFEHESDLRSFVDDGYELGVSANLAAQPGGSAYNGAVQVQPGVWLYQLSDAGLALDLTVAGTKYFKDPELN